MGIEGREMGGVSSAGGQPSGDRPSGDRPSGDRPSGDRPSGDRPSVERLVRGAGLSGEVSGEGEYGGHTAMRNLTAKLAEGEHVRLEALSEVLGMGRSELLREVLKAGLDDLEAALPVEAAAALQREKRVAAQEARRQRMESGSVNGGAGEGVEAGKVLVGRSLSDGSPVVYSPEPSFGSAALMVAGENDEDSAEAFARLAVRTASARGAGVFVDVSGKVAERAREEFDSSELLVHCIEPGQEGSLPLLEVYPEGEEREAKTLVRGVLQGILELGGGGRESSEKKLVLREGIERLYALPARERRLEGSLEAVFRRMAREEGKRQAECEAALGVAEEVSFLAANTPASVILGGDASPPSERRRYTVLDLSALGAGYSIRDRLLTTEEQTVHAGVLPVAAATALRMSTSDREPDVAALYPADALLASTPEIRSLLEHYIRLGRSNNSTAVVGLRSPVPPDTLALIPNRLVCRHEVASADNGLALLGIEPSRSRREQLARLLPGEALFRAEDGEASTVEVYTEGQ